MNFVSSPWGILITKPFIVSEHSSDLKIKESDSLKSDDKILNIICSGYFEARMFIRWIGREEKPFHWYCLDSGIPHLNIYKPCRIAYLPDKDPLGTYILDSGNPLLVLNDIDKPIVNNDIFVLNYGHLKATAIRDIDYDILKELKLLKKTSDNTITEKSNLFSFITSRTNIFKRIFFMDLPFQELIKTTLKPKISDESDDLPYISSKYFKTSDSESDEEDSLTDKLEDKLEDKTDILDSIRSGMDKWYKEHILLDINGHYSKFSKRFFEYFDVSSDYKTFNDDHLRYMMCWIHNKYPDKTIWINKSSSTDSKILSSLETTFLPLY